MVKFFLLTQRIPSQCQSQGTVFKAALRQAQGPPFDKLRDRPLINSVLFCHPELVSGAVKVVAECFTDAKITCLQ
ncbi:MAG: hypothetical protein IIU30_01665, partial [Treponema sp.]|nr:hypothetical protein [Treponema sp.]